MNTLKRINRLSPISVRNLLSKTQNAEKIYFLPLPHFWTKKYVEEEKREKLSYRIERTDSAFIITLSYRNDVSYPSDNEIVVHSKSYFIPVSSKELGRYLPPEVRSCGMIYRDGILKIVVPLSQWEKRDLTKILVEQDIYSFNFKSRRNHFSIL